MHVAGLIVHNSLVNPKLPNLLINESICNETFQFVTVRLLSDFILTCKAHEIHS